MVGTGRAMHCSINDTAQHTGEERAVLTWELGTQQSCNLANVREGIKPSRLANVILLLHPLWKYHSAIAVNVSLHFCTRSWLHSSFPNLSSKGCAERVEAKLSLEPLHIPLWLLKDRRWQIGAGDMMLGTSSVIFGGWVVSSSVTAALGCVETQGTKYNALPNHSISPVMSWPAALDVLPGDLVREHQTTALVSIQSSWEKTCQVNFTA